MPTNDEVCKVIKKNQKQLFERMTVSHVYHLSETYRLYKCENSLKSIPDQVESIFKNEVTKMTKPANLHYAFEMN